MATITSFLKVIDGGNTLPNRELVMWNKLDFSATNVAASDVVQVFKVPANTLITDVKVYVVTADGETATGDLGDGSSATRYFSNIDLNATGLSDVDVTTLTTPVYTAADTIDLTADHALENAVVVVMVKFVVSPYSLT